MLTISKSLQDDLASVLLQGRLDTVTAPELEKELTGLIPEINALVLDFSGLEYVSSAGLRVLLAAQKLMSAKSGSMKLVHVDPMIMDVFEMTGFSEILTIE